MMEHIRDFDWLAQEEEEYFVNEHDLDNCTIEKILKNKFRDPLLSSESEDEKPNNIDWDEVFSSKLNFKNKLFIPCLRPVAPYPKLSTLSIQQHNQILKVLSANNPTVLEGLDLGKPNYRDINGYKEAGDIYAKEQQAYKDWAKSLWLSSHCIRALRPRPCVERAYEAQFALRARRARPLPPRYGVAAQLPLGTHLDNCHLVLKKELITVKLSEMPKVEIPERIEKQFSIMKPYPVPEPCQKHVYQIILPNENSMSVLPITEVHRSLAAYAGSMNAQYIASENAIKCLVQHERHWTLPISVCEAINSDGDKVNVVVLDSEFSVNKESAPMRTYKAFRHLLEHALIPASERQKVMKKGKNPSENLVNKKVVCSPNKAVWDNNSAKVASESSDDEDDGNLVIDTGEDILGSTPTSANQAKKQKTTEAVSPSRPYQTRAAVRRISEECQDIGLYNCTCKGSLYEHPPRRSYKMWRVKNKSNEGYDIIIHCPHKARGEREELILEPIPEYQIDLGAAEQSLDSVRTVALALAIRKNASVLNVRIDGPTGDVVHWETVRAEQFSQRHPDVMRHVSSVLHAALRQLQGLLPGQYVLQHEPAHGSNALLLAPQPQGASPVLQLNFDSSQLLEPDEAKMVKTPPTICTQLLPYHKYRRIVPCAFTPYENQLVKESKKSAAKKKAPPAAIKWPNGKKSRRKRKRRT